MKRMTDLLFLFALCLSLVACNSAGKINNAEIDYGSSAKYSEIEIISAVDVALKKFKGFQGCELKRIWYDEEMSDRIIRLDMLSDGGNAIKNSGAEPEDLLILFSDFKTSESSAYDGFNSNFDYTGWKWILARDNKTDKWKVIEWGF